MSSSVVTNSQDYGPKLSPDPSWTGPLNVERSTTDVKWLIVFLLCFILWIAAPLSTLSEKVLEIEFEDDSFFLVQSVALGMMVFSALLATLYICLLRIAPMAVIYASIGSFLVSLAFGIGLYAYKLAVQGYGRWDYWLPLVGLCLFLWLPGMALNPGVIKLLKLPSEIIPEFAKAVVFFPSLYLYAILIHVLCCCALLGGIAAVMSTIVFSEWFSIICVFLEIYFVVWLCATLVASFNVTVAGAYATWYWTTDKRQVPYFTVGRFIWIAFRYHLGSAAMGALAQPACHLIRAIECCSNARVQALGEILAFEQMALHGRPLLESARTAHNLWRRNYARIGKIVMYVKTWTNFIWLSVSFTSALLVHRGVLLSLSWDRLQFHFYIFPFTLNLMLVFIMLLMINTACDTILLCVLEDHEVNGRNARNMSDKLTKLIIESE